MNSPASRLVVTRCMQVETAGDCYIGEAAAWDSLHLVMLGGTGHATAAGQGPSQLPAGARAQATPANVAAFIANIFHIRCSHESRQCRGRVAYFK